MLGEIDLLLVIGSRNSSNSNRLVDVAPRRRRRRAPDRRRDRHRRGLARRRRDGRRDLGRLRARRSSSSASATGSARAASRTSRRTGWSTRTYVQAPRGAPPRARALAEKQARARGSVSSSCWARYRLQFQVRQSELWRRARELLGRAARARGASVGSAFTSSGVASSLRLIRYGRSSLGRSRFVRAMSASGFTTLMAKIAAKPLDERADGEQLDAARAGPWPQPTRRRRRARSSLPSRRAGAR